MASTDSPLKRLVSTFITDFATWLLKDSVQEAHPLNVELPATTLAADQVFHITLANGETLLLHIEFQARQSHAPMPWRMLEYMARLAYTHRLAVRSIVFYVGRGAGADDSGRHEVGELDGAATLVWRYQVIHLWRMQAEELVALGIPALLALVGQTRIDRPQRILPTVVAHLRRVPDVERRGRLLTALLALMPDEEMVVMVERLLDNDALLLDTPYLRRLREEGALTMRRQDIVRALELRFGLQETIDAEVAQRLEQIIDHARLETLFAAAIHGETMAVFLTALEEAHRDGRAE